METVLAELYYGVGALLRFGPAADTLLIVTFLQDAGVQVSPPEPNGIPELKLKPASTPKPENLNPKTGPKAELKPKLLL